MRNKTQRLAKYKLIYIQYFDNFPFYVPAQFSGEVLFLISELIGMAGTIWQPWPTRVYIASHLVYQCHKASSRIRSLKSLPTTLSSSFFFRFTSLFLFFFSAFTISFIWISASTSLCFSELWTEEKDELYIENIRNIDLTSNRLKKNLAYIRKNLYIRNSQLNIEKHDYKENSINKAASEAASSLPGNSLWDDHFAILCGE